MPDGICLCVILGTDTKVFGKLAASEAIGSLMGLQKNCKAIKCVSLTFISWSVEFPLAKLGIKQTSSAKMFTSS